MLNGIAPILIFNFKKLAPSFLQSINNIPLLAENNISIPLIPIPIYLEARLTGVHILSESKNIDIKTDADAQPDGSKPKVSQSPLASTVTINMVANNNSIGLNILLAMSDVIFTKVASQEYSVSYVSGAMSVFGGLLDSFSCNQDVNSSLYNISMQITNAPSGGTIEKAAPATIQGVDGASLGANVA